MSVSSTSKVNAATLRVDGGLISKRCAERDWAESVTDRNVVRVCIDQTGLDKNCSQVESYSYDGNGNRTGTGYSTPIMNETATSPGITYTFDKAGNVISANSGGRGGVSDTQHSGVSDTQHSG